MASSPHVHHHSSIFSVSQDEFLVFHTIDRTLFARMVYTLGRDPAESTQVMAMWLWLEQNGEEFNLIHKMLSLPDALIDALAEEAVMAISCIENDKFPFEITENGNGNNGTVDIPLIQHLSKTAVSLRFFHENRLRILRGVTKICNDICLRAFQDMLQDFESQRLLSRASLAIRSGNFPAALLGGAAAGYLGLGGMFGGNNNHSFFPGFFQNNNNPPSFGMFGNLVSGLNSPVASAATATATATATGGGVGLDCYDHLLAQRQIMNREIISDVFNRLELNIGNIEDHENGDLVPPDERTIFLTFSKGYPISEDEVRDYFGRKYGNFIESIHMQEVQQAEEQPLYARLVVKHESSIDVVLEGRTKAKFSINGKHVWARKYVRKNPRLPLRSDVSSSPPSRPSSPAFSLPRNNNSASAP